MTIIKYYTRRKRWFVVTFLIVFFGLSSNLLAKKIEYESVHACVIPSSIKLNKEYRAKIADCLGWRDDLQSRFCPGYYSQTPYKSSSHPGAIEISADKTSLYLEGYSTLRGNVEVREDSRNVTAQTARIYRDPKTKKITQVELIGGVRYSAPDVLIYASKASLNPVASAGTLEDVIYRFKVDRAKAYLPAWGRAAWIERFENRDYLLKKATYTTCAPKDKAWQISADKIHIDDSKAAGVAKNAYLDFHGFPVLYTPYMSFPTTSARKSGFLTPISGYTNVSGFDYGMPYYFNIAPNFDATFIPHIYSFRGLMLGGNTRYMTQRSMGIFGLTYLPHDAKYNSFLMQNRDEFPVLKGQSSDRWSVMFKHKSQFTRNLVANINFKQISDDYYFQDFSTNLAISSMNQILREGDVTYVNKNWTLFGMLQSYQTLHPINQSPVANIYERLPQLYARGHYDNLPMNADFRVLGEFDNFHWNGRDFILPQGPRYHVSPLLAFPFYKPWGYLKPEIQLVENYYDLNARSSVSDGAVTTYSSYNRTIPRYSVDTGLTFTRDVKIFSDKLKETIEPRVYYLNVPYKNQSFYPAFDSAYMIFNTDQLFRNNRFSGLDRISDANQIAYGSTMRWISPKTGLEVARLSLGQVRYFAERKVQLCYNSTGTCTDSPLFLGYVSPLSTYSPIASKFTYALSSIWSLSSDYVWDPYTSATNNGNVILRYQPTPDRILSFGYNYIVSGNLLISNLYGNGNAPINIKNSPLNQATASYAWPLNENWSSLAAYSYNMSAGYSMLTFLGLQYDSCCWAARILGGRQFKSLGIDSHLPTYNNNIYFQILLKGLGSASSSDPASTIGTYLPGYPNLFSK